VGIGKNTSGGGRLLGGPQGQQCLAANERAGKDRLN
jgi:hypothetical protein